VQTIFSGISVLKGVILQSFTRYHDHNPPIKGRQKAPPFDHGDENENVRAADLLASNHLPDSFPI
jgi:hypothetical protein